MTVTNEVGPFFHGTKADLRPGDLIEAGRRSNFGSGGQARFVYLTATLDAATWGAELAQGSGPGRIHRVEPTGRSRTTPTSPTKGFSRTPPAPTAPVTR